MRYFPHSDDMVAIKLKAINKTHVEELFASLPESCRLKRPLNVPKALDELSLKRSLKSFLLPPSATSFLGAGAAWHFVPEWVSQQLMRAEWYTSYTPYQPEASQGTLQAIFEFQSMIASLFGLDVANASMYDGATALMEALAMAVRITGKKTVVVSKTIHPEYRQVLKTYFAMAEYTIIEMGFDESGVTNERALKDCLTSCSDVAAIAIQTPNFFGRLEDFSKIAKCAHEKNALMVGCVTDLSSTALIASLGAQGADIAVGEGLGLVGGLSMGGPGVGLLACKKDLIRQMPGRLVGKTTDQRNHDGYVLTLSTREQHIRREKATSNICTNHNLMALALSMTLAAYGSVGFRHLALTNMKKTLLLRKYLSGMRIKPAFIGPHYNETVVQIGDQKLLEKRLSQGLDRGIIAGLPLVKFYPELAGHLMVATTELHTDEDIKDVAQIIAGVAHG